MRLGCRNACREGGARVLAPALPLAINAVIFGIAGIGHILPGVGMVLLLLQMSGEIPPEKVKNLTIIPRFLLFAQAIGKTRKKQKIPENKEKNKNQ